MGNLLLYGGRIITMEEDRPTAEAVLIMDGRILAVGDREDVSERYTQQVLQ